MRYNDPFYFALPASAGAQTMRRAILHIGSTFGVRGRVEVVRRELAFTLCRITDLEAVPS